MTKFIVYPCNFACCWPNSACQGQTSHVKSIVTCAPVAGLGGLIWIWILHRHPSRCCPQGQDAKLVSQSWPAVSSGSIDLGVPICSLKGEKQSGRGGTHGPWSRGEGKPHSPPWPRPLPPVCQCRIHFSVNVSRGKLPILPYGQQLLFLPGCHLFSCYFCDFIFKQYSVEYSNTEPGTDGKLSK